MSQPSIKRRVLIVGEGRKTEYHYFLGFRRAYEAELDAAATSVSVARGKGGSANQIVERAVNEAKRFSPNRNRGDRVFLVMDTEGAGRAPELPAAEIKARKNDIEIVYSCPSFEYWLLCHFDGAPRRHFEKSEDVEAELNKRWPTVRNIAYDKGDEEVFDRLADRVDKAREQALATDLHHLKTKGEACRVNPSTQVYELIARLVGVDGARCPIDGKWAHIASGEPVELKKGMRFPPGSPEGWRLSSW